ASRTASPYPYTGCLLFLLDCNGLATVFCCVAIRVPGNGRLARALRNRPRVDGDRRLVAIARQAIRVERFDIMVTRRTPRRRDVRSIGAAVPSYGPLHRRAARVGPHSEDVGRLG